MQSGIDRRVGSRCRDRCRLSELNDLLFIEANPIPVKWVMAQRGMIEDGIRLPLTPLSEPCRGDLERALETYFA